MYIYKNIVFPALAEYSQIIRMCESQLHHVNFDPKYPKILTLTCFALFCCHNLNVSTYYEFYFQRFVNQSTEDDKRICHEVVETFKCCRFL